MIKCYGPYYPSCSFFFGTKLGRNAPIVQSVLLPSIGGDKKANYIKLYFKDKSCGIVEAVPNREKTECPRWKAAANSLDLELVFRSVCMRFTMRPVLRAQSRGEDSSQ